MKWNRIFSWRHLRIIAAFLFLTGFVFAFYCGGLPGKILPHLQFGPAVLSLFAAFSTGAFCTMLGILLSAFLFGRFYCAFFCPFGIFQDIIAFLSRRKSRMQSSHAAIRYAVCGIVFGLLTFGCAGGFFLLDPYSNSGRILASFSIGSAIPLLAIIILSVWRKRIYCTTICPVGTVLGLASRFSLFRMMVKGKCVRCGKCVSVCPSGCIDIEKGIIDNERCVRCMNCVSICPLHSIRLSLPEKKEPAMDLSRRRFLVNGGILIAGFAAGAVLMKSGILHIREFAKRFRILPPGAGNAERFASRCTGCQLCTANCPEKIIVPAPNGAGPVSLDLSKGRCGFDCNRCSEVCPTGAILPLNLKTKRRTKIAEVKFQPRNCIVFQEGTKCGKCAKACPTGAVKLRRTGAPRVNASLCIGCGACQYVCPAKEKAMTVEPIETQELI